MMISLNFKLSKATLCKSIKPYAENEFNRFLLWKEKFQVLTKSFDKKHIHCHFKRAPQGNNNALNHVFLPSEQIYCR